MPSVVVGVTVSLFVWHGWCFQNGLSMSDQKVVCSAKLGVSRVNPPTGGPCGLQDPAQTVPYNSLT